ncbi:hypothetical protein [Anatilimnocola floriformis]|uniref:hypothetical protein n=1 Tax=Anatilimnocola floriformis TaxID=2948575 RepID=UPI0020C3D6FA|nr:hypothetical protein [Anatilimnocola floriformis]
MELLAGAVSQKTSSVSLYYMHLPLHWVGLGMLVAIVGAWLVFRWRSARLKRLNSPRQLLRSLFRLHEMGWSERQLLLTSARRQKVKDPARYFLESELWRQAIEAERSASNRQRLAQLQLKVLGSC